MENPAEFNILLTSEIGTQALSFFSSFKRTLTSAAPPSGRIPDEQTFEPPALHIKYNIKYFVF